MISANSRITHKIAKNWLGASTVERTKESETHPLSDGPSFLEAQITLSAIDWLTDDDVIQHLDL
jgi:hypothetical protein